MTTPNTWRAEWRAIVEAFPLDELVAMVDAITDELRYREERLKAAPHEVQGTSGGPRMAQDRRSSRHRYQGPGPGDDDDDVEV